MNKKQIGTVLAVSLAGLLAAPAQAHEDESDMMGSNMSMMSGASKDCPGMKGGMGMMGRGMMMGRMMMGMGGGMMGMSPDKLPPEVLDRMADHMQKMHEQAAKLSETDDPAQRRELAKAHVKEMQDFMKEMIQARWQMAKQGRQNWREEMEQRMRRLEEMMKQGQQGQMMQR